MNSILNGLLKLFTHDIWMIFSFLSIICIVIQYLKLSAKSSRKTIVMEKPFEDEWANEMYALSFTPPFSEVINPDENHPRVKDLEKIIAESGLAHKLNYRVFTVMQLLLVAIGFGVFLVFMLMSEQLGFLLGFLFNVDVAIDSVNYKKNLALMLIMGILILALIPKMYLKKRAKRNEFYFQKDLPILQLFIILILRAKRPIRELLYVLSKTETRYRELFSNAYRVYLRNENEGFVNLKKTFGNSKMENTMNILSEFNDYSKEESLMLLENNLEDIIQEANNMKRKKDIAGTVMSQGSLLFPLAGVVLLGLLPLAMYGMNSLTMATKAM